MSTVVHAERALLPEGWRRDVAVALDATGRIVSVATDAPHPEGRGRILLPALCDLHSHTFQRAMAGMAERRGPGPDSFWTWRELMYRFLDHLSPAEIEAIAAFAFVEMQEAGFAAVAEFHYLHHAPGGRPYADPAELSARICAAAADSGIGLTLLPVLYTHGGAGAAPLAGGQLRFGCALDAYLDLAARAGAILAETLAPDARIGTAPHSLRATTPDDLRALVAARPDGPMHVHAAEQVREVEDVLAWLGARPIDWLLDEIGLDARWCLIHATQTTPGEVARLARSGAVAGLCPVTEANLGDGIFDAPGFLAAGGAFGVGSDSNVRITVAEELRQLEYSQRLRDRARNVVPTEPGSTGAALYAGALAGGAQALGRASGAIRPGLWADLVGLDAGHVAFAGLRDDQILDGWIFAAGPGAVADVWSAGRSRVRGGRHVARDRIEAAYRAALAALMDRI